jgi:sugar lactone lactonase YvrE
MTRPVAIVLGLVLAGAAYLAFWPVWIDPVAWTPSPDPGWTGVFSADHSRGVEFTRMDIGPGPEDIAAGPDGLLYTGLADGRIVRFAPDGTRVEDFAQTGGRPLGLQFDALGRLVVADFDRGLLRIAPDGTVDLLTDHAGDEAIRFADDLDIAADGTIWFSDLTTRLPDDLHLDCWEGRASGRLLAFEPGSAATTVRAANLHYPNGVALGPAEQYILVCEMIASRVVRIWLRGPRAGEREVFLSELPACTDNLSYDGDGLFWIALVGSRSRAFERFARAPFIRRAMMRVPGLPIPHPMPWRRSRRYDGCAIAVDTTGVVRASVHDPAGRYGAVTSVNRYGEYVFIGSIEMESVARVPADRGLHAHERPPDQATPRETR